MTATYIHTRRKLGLSQMILRFLAVLYFIGLAASVAYLWFYTQDRFITSAAFRISRQDSSSMDVGLAQMILPGLSDSGSADSQTAIGYINSADLLLALEQEFDLRKHYSSPLKDFVFRLESDATLEKRLEYYRKRIFAHFDKDSGLTMIKVDTFSPELSQKIAVRLLKRAENFVNVINQSLAEQQVAFIRSEVERNTKQVDDLNQKLLALQNANNLINPDEIISANLAAVQEMRMDRLRTEADLSTILRDSPGSPRIENIRSRLRSLNESIDVETAKLSGPEQDRLNQLLLQFNELRLKLEFATKLRSGAEMLLEKNRVEAISRTRFFTVIQNPFLPEDIGMPLRPYATVTMLCLGLLGFLVLRALTHSVFERA